jgi:hypothetical protein
MASHHITITFMWPSHYFEFVYSPPPLTSVTTNSWNDHKCCIRHGKVGGEEIDSWKETMEVMGIGRN